MPVSLKVKALELSKYLGRAHAAARIADFRGYKASTPTFLRLRKDGAPAGGPKKQGMHGGNVQVPSGFKIQVLGIARRSPHCWRPLNPSLRGCGCSRGARLVLSGTLTSFIWVVGDGNVRLACVCTVLLKLSVRGRQKFAGPRTEVLAGVLTNEFGVSQYRHRDSALFPTLRFR